MIVERKGISALLMKVLVELKCSSEETADQTQSRLTLGTSTFKLWPLDKEVTLQLKEFAGSNVGSKVVTL